MIKQILDALACPVPSCRKPLKLAEDESALQCTACGRTYPIKEGIPMLVLSRRIGEQIIINNNIRVTVVSLDGGKVRLGIEAPRDVRVDRQEVAERRREFAAPDHCVEA